MARYIMEEMPDIQKTGKRITYPKFARIDNASIKELARRVGDVSGFSAGDIEGVLLQTAIEMAHLMAEGRSVKIDGIGTFTPSLTLGRDKEREDAEEGGKHRNAQSIFIGGVNFRVDREMVRNISDRCPNGIFLSFYISQKTKELLTMMKTETTMYQVLLKLCAFLM